MSSTLVGLKPKCFLLTSSSLPVDADGDAIFIIVDHDEIDLSEALSARLDLRVGTTYIFGPQIVFSLLKLPADSRERCFAGATNSLSKGCLDLSDGVQFVTLLRYSGSYGSEYEDFYIKVGHFNAERTLSACNDLSWLMHSGHRPQWYLEEEYSYLFTDEFHSWMDNSREEPIGAYFARGRYRKIREAAFLTRSLEHIALGSEHATLFEEWACAAISFLFETGLRAVTLKPNGQSAERRDVVGENFGGTYFWRRVLDDYRVRLATFEIKNYSEIGGDECKQVGNYLSQPHYGNLGLLIYRCDLEKPTENLLKHFRQTYNNGSDKKVLMMLPTKTVSRMLSMIAHGNFSDPDYAMSDLLNKHILRYLCE